MAESHPVSSQNVSASPSNLTSPPNLTSPDIKQSKSSKGEKKSKISKETSTHPLEITPPPVYINHRIQLFERLKKEYDESLKSKPHLPINITLPTGDIKQGISWETTPLDIAKNISKSLLERCFISKVNGELWDLDRPFEDSSTLELLDFDHDEAKKVYWHSSAHILGEACERHYGCNLAIGPPVEDGFYYEMGMNDDRTVATSDYQPLETIIKSVLKEKQPFERLLISKENLLDMFKHNPYKQHIIQSKIPDGTFTTVYRCGPLIDLCRGPHVPHTGRIKTLAILKNSASYFMGDPTNDSLQRIYGISFPDKKLMDEHKKFLLEAAKRDHRKIGKDQDLFFFHELSPGSCFFMPLGARIYNTLLDLMKSEYRKRGFHEVISPNMYNSKLWQTSGHWANYQEDMFIFDIDKEKFGLKPMNCPGHCLIFKHRARSHRELPLRMADFGVLHRNEASGALTGLTRVRRFQQDDAHIFCTPEQIESEVAGCFDFLSKIYGIFGFTFKLELSTRPEKYIGNIENWNQAEKMLENALNKFHFGKWQINPGDGAFYGPKIDITIQDALKRWHQCATIQLDFNLPERFDLDYDAAIKIIDQPSRPVMIHRAILGSLERMIAILTEHFAGKWPFWLSPRQIVIIPVDPKFGHYAMEISELLNSKGFFADADLSGDTLNKKIRNGEIHQYNFIFVVGEVEMNEKSVNIRSRDDIGSKAKNPTIPLSEAIEKLEKLKQERRLDCQLV